MKKDKMLSSESIRGSRASLIESFGVYGLYGYRSITLDSAYAATVLIARNGTGKTTLLGVLDAFLRLQFSRLRNLEFAEIRCKIRNHGQELVLRHEDVIEFLQVPNDGDFQKLASRANIIPAKLFSFLTEDMIPRPQKSYSYGNSEVYDAIWNSVNYNFSEARSICDKLRQDLYRRHPNIELIWNVITSALDGHEIVYLPTYRRIELALTDEETPLHRKKNKPLFNVASGSLYTGDIQFGLSDISERLSELNHQIILESNNGYRSISANIINDLIDGSFDSQEEVAHDLPTEDELKLFFERLEQGRRMGPYPPVSIPNIGKIYSENSASESSSKFLKYFLGQLSTVIATSKALEAPVDGFVENCNKYLLSPEPSTQRSNYSASIGVAGKKLQLNRRDLRVYVTSVPGGRKISLDALSSGEKQMISLFARLYLYPNKKIVLIDEPELSLSIDWQRQILVDVLNSPSCEQVIAITHSPFIFDNDLDPFAKSLIVREEVSGLSINSAPNDEDQLDV